MGVRSSLSSSSSTIDRGGSGQKSRCLHKYAPITANAVKPTAAVVDPELVSIIAS
jgi:hypothetical protein